MQLPTSDKRYLWVIYGGSRFDRLTELLAKTVHCDACTSYHEGQVARLALAAESNAHVHVFLVAPLVLGFGYSEVPLELKGPQQTLIRNDKRRMFKRSSEQSTMGKKIWNDSFQEYFFVI